MILNGRLVEGASQPIIIQFLDSNLITSPTSTESETQHYASLSLRSPRTSLEMTSFQPASPTLCFAFAEISPPIEYTFLVSNLPLMVTTLQLLSLFAPFGQIFEIAVHTTPSLDGSHLLCTGTAILRLYGPAYLRDNALRCLHGAFIFPDHLPLMVSLFHFPLT